MPDRFRFSTRSLLVWLALYALALGAMAGLAAMPMQIVAAMLVLTAFIIFDSVSATDRSAIPPLARYSIVVAHYATALAIAVAVCFALFCKLPHKALPPQQQPLPFVAAVTYLVTGHTQRVNDIPFEIGRAIDIAIAYCGLFALSSGIGFLSSLLAWRHFRSAKWYALVNATGTCLLIFFLVAAMLD